MTALAVAAMSARASPAVDDGRFIFNTLDGQTIALDVNDGRELWRTRMADVSKGETITVAPVVVKGKVLIGNSGGEYGVRGWLAALDARTGKMVWRAYSTGPDKDVLIGASFKPYYAKDRGTDLGVSSWQPEGWKLGGGTVWGWLSYDPSLDLIYYGTANPAPWNPHQRPGDNKWTSGIFARNPDTGEARWFYQMSPHDVHDYDGVNENVLVDLELGGAPRKLLLHPDRNGYVYVLDRATGEIVSANAYVPVNTTKGVDLKTGALQYVPEKEPQIGRVGRGIARMGKRIAPAGLQLERIPVVHGRDPLWQARGAPDHVEGLATATPELLVTTVLDARPDHRLVFPTPSLWPLVSALATTAMFIGSIFNPWVVVWGSIPIAIALTCWFWPTRAESEQHLALEKRP